MLHWVSSASLVFLSTLTSLFASFTTRRCVANPVTSSNCLAFVRASSFCRSKWSQNSPLHGRTKQHPVPLVLLHPRPQLCDPPLERFPLFDRLFRVHHFPLVAPQEGHRSVSSLLPDWPQCGVNVLLAVKSVQVQGTQCFMCIGSAAAVAATCTITATREN